MTGTNYNLSHCCLSVEAHAGLPCHTARLWYVNDAIPKNTLDSSLKHPSLAIKLLQHAWI